MATEFPEPYAVIYTRSKAGTAVFDGPAWRRIPTGVNTLMLSWSGTESLFVKKRVPGIGDTELPGIPAGNGHRTTTISGVGSRAGEAATQIYVHTTSTQPAGVDATMTVITTPLKDAGA